MNTDEKIIDATPKELMDICQAVPSHLRLRGWFVGKPAFGQQYVYADNFMGRGRQSLFSICSGLEYFDGLAEFVARFDPPTVAQLLYRMTHAEVVAINHEQEARLAVELRGALRQALKELGRTPEQIEARLSEFTPDPSAWSNHGDRPMSETARGAGGFGSTGA